MTIDEKVMGLWHHILSQPTTSAQASIAQIKRRGERLPDIVQNIVDSKDAYLSGCQKLLEYPPNPAFKNYNPSQSDLEFLQGLYEKAQVIDWEDGNKVKELSEELGAYTGYKPFS
ncbi:MAG: hypothetical protein EPN86_01710 [Nanoarchaeota archaeon]|nr:MAG: hypothetical protein EPN86_01710 [Nanoarchaeota archaeon]